MSFSCRTTSFYKQRRSALSLYLYLMFLSVRWTAASEVPTWFSRTWGMESTQHISAIPKLEELGKATGNLSTLDPMAALSWEEFSMRLSTPLVNLFVLSVVDFKKLKAMVQFLYNFCNRGDSRDDAARQGLVCQSSWGEFASWKWEELPKERDRLVQRSRRCIRLWLRDDVWPHRLRNLGHCWAEEDHHWASCTRSKDQVSGWIGTSKRLTDKPAPKCFID